MKYYCLTLLTAFFWPYQIRGWMLCPSPNFGIFVRTQPFSVRKTCIFLHLDVPLQHEWKTSLGSYNSVRHSEVKDIFLICFSRLVFK